MGPAPLGGSAGLLSRAEIEDNFADIKPMLDKTRAVVDSARCFFCHDAPCVEACPTDIDIPNFIRMISTGNVKGAAEKILAENIFGGMCARVCPTEILCERACVRNTSEDRPVDIGALQRYAVDQLIETGHQPFTRAESTGKRVAVVGGGPAGMSCAHRLAVLGHAVTVYEARPQLGGLNEYGIAAYKTVDNFAQREVDFILSIGGIDVKPGQRLGQNVQLADLARDYDAVFLGIGLGGVNALDLPGENELSGVLDAVGYIAALRQAKDKAALPVGRSVVVIGGGNTAIDIAIQVKKLGAEDVTIVYRRGAENMSATGHEQEFAQVSGVKIKHWARPILLIGKDGAIAGVEFEYTRMGSDGKLSGTGEKFRLDCDQLFKAIGQTLTPPEGLATAKGKIVVDGDFKTSMAKVWAGGDCVASGTDLTVQSVQDGKLAAHAIDRALRANGAVRG
ncbi:NAD(P)-dependent oxidoreductase [Dongia sedimenti]|uniref:dihydrouracil dehydrogenase (NAD(+)) n=1 Tax=Dongia sedimenti TaxID=3064282 RepID=A0ABU0YFQ8_9PROT|nr:NAD(P)-dependent oxidoreductase [Rhodospirillaceae bacterium R-7]